MLNRLAIVALFLGTIPLALAGDATPYVVGQHVEVVGHVYMRGNAPFLYPVLQTSGGIIWVLDGVDRQAIEPWIGKAVHVSGAVSRWDEPHSNLPIIDVDAFRRAPP